MPYRSYSRIGAVSLVLKLKLAVGRRSERDVDDYHVTLDSVSVSQVLNRGKYAVFHPMNEAAGVGNASFDSFKTLSNFCSSTDGRPRSSV